MTVGEDRQTLAAQRAHPRHRLNGFEQIPERIDTYPAGATQGRFVNIDDSKWPAPLISAMDRATTEGDHGLVARSGTRCRHKLSSTRNLVELHQDRFCFWVGSQPVEHVGQIDIEACAQVQHRRKADSLAVGAIKHGCRDGRRLRDQRNLARHDRDGGGAGVKPPAGHDETAASWPQNTHQIRLGGFENGLARLRYRINAHLVPHPRPNDHRTGATGTELSDDRRHQIQRRTNDRQIGHHIEFAEADIVAHVKQ